MTMSKIFISGSMNIKNIDSKVVQRINNMIKSNFNILVGDATGADSSIQYILKEKKYDNVTVYCSGGHPRNNTGSWNVKSISTDYKENTRSYFTAKDLVMAKDCDYGLMIWDTKSTGTLSNVYELLVQNKTSVVFVNKRKEFSKISNIEEFEKLISIMSNDAYLKANKKINLLDKIKNLKNRQLNIFEANQQIQATGRGAVA